jgi:RND superfamily putative drug exporter
MNRGASEPAAIFERWGRFAFRHKWSVALVWLVGFAAVVTASIAFSGEYEAHFALPGAESQRAADLLEERFPAQSGDSARLVFFAEDGIDDPAVRPRVEAILDEASRLPGVEEVSSPFEQPGAISGDGRTAFATVQYPLADGSDAKELVALVERSGSPGLIVEAGGMPVEMTEQGSLGESEIIGLAAAAFILVIAFGSVVAMGVPIITALFSLGATLALLGILARVLGMTEFTPSFAAMIGLGVGIDYALLVITRFRENLHSGRNVEDSVAVAVDTAGRSVLFAGLVVIIAMMGLVVIGVPFVAALGVAAALVVATSVLAALTLLPAVLSILGRRVDSLAIPFLRQQEADYERSTWYRLSRAIQRRPWLFLSAGAGVLLLLTVPLLSIETNFTDASNASPETHSRRAYDLLSDGFGPGFNGPLTVVVDLQGGEPEQLQRLVAAFEGTEGVAGVTQPRLNEAGDTAIITVLPASAPQDTATNRLVHTLRESVIPGALGEDGATAYITGPTAATIDVGDQIRSRMPWFFGIVIGLSFVVLMIVFRSILVPLKAALMNLLSIGAALGIVVTVFQWGWFAGPLGVDQTGPIETFLPMMLFAILFGLSMDYEVFLVSRIHEEYMNGKSNSEAVAMGLSTTARVITSAALIMIAVFGSFLLSGERVLQEFGLGLAVAIFLDATVVRLLIVPAIMELAGDANWWLPKSLDRVLPRIDVEGRTRARRVSAAGIAAGE